MNRQNSFDKLHYPHFPGGRPVWPWASWRERVPAKTAKSITKTTKTTHKRLRRGYALTLKGRPIALAPSPIQAGSKLAEAKAARRMHGGAR